MQMKNFLATQYANFDMKLGQRFQCETRKLGTPKRGERVANGAIGMCQKSTRSV